MGTAKPRLVTPEQADSFRRDGFVVIPDLLSPEELVTFGTAVSNAVVQRKREDRRRLEHKSRYEQSFIQCQNLWEDFPEVKPLTFHPRLGQAAAELLGGPAVRIWHDQALFKEPGGRETDLHQDQPYWPINEPSTVTAWIPFEGSTVASGCMGYVPGSHQAGIEAFVDIFRGDDGATAAQAAALRTADPVFVEVPPGAVAFHHGYTAHLAKPNQTDRMRAVHTVIYFLDGCTRRPGRPHPSVDRAGIKDGAVIDSAVTPIAWPRDGDLPEPPPPIPHLPESIRRSGILPVR